MTREIWDAYDKDGNKLGFDQFRDKPIPEGVYHIVVEIYTLTENNEVLMTKRHQNKPWALKWEVTGGSILKGETTEQGAIRIETCTIWKKSLQYYNFRRYFKFKVV